MLFQNISARISGGMNVYGGGEQINPEKNSSFISGVFNSQKIRIKQEQMVRFGMEINAGVEIQKAGKIQTYVGYYGQLRHHYDIHAAMFHIKYDL